MLNVSDLKIIASNGGGMIIDAKKILVSDLKIIVSNASNKGGKIIIKNPMVLSALDMKIIASNSDGCVIFDFFNN
ncbi:hypothetical protein ACNHQI_18490 [Klebsiella quasipneumoniae]|uniref:hypothetical protein n=1 Tax=Klebsiella quasipneumoniae TaxID=1463165 RepID=UPI003A80A25B